jgi:hypothetical protein
MSTDPVRNLEPDRVIKGESAEWKRYFCDYPATLWTLEYRFRGPGTGFNVTATADGVKFDSVITTTNSNAVTAGRYQWQAWATNIADTSIVRMIEEGVTIFETGFVSNTTTSVELRSQAKQIVDSIDTAFAAFASSDILEYEIMTPAGTRRVRRSDKTLMLSLRKEYAAIVDRENLAQRTRDGKPFATTVVARMRSNR